MKLSSLILITYFLWPLGVYFIDIHKNGSYSTKGRADVFLRSMKFMWNSKFHWHLSLYLFFTFFCIIFFNIKKLEILISDITIPPLYVAFIFVVYFMIFLFNFKKIETK